RRSSDLDEFPSWRNLESHSTPQIDAQGRPFVQVNFAGREVPVGICSANALRISRSPELVQDLVLSRLEAQLKAKKPRISEQSVQSDWKLLESAREESEATLTPAGSE
ncbi:MAG TPA: hypothetical protein VFM77_19625, partial [Terriglobales bacterium]|nr:hypothetical protein [Terriglobales bacterium]